MAVFFAPDKPENRANKGQVIGKVLLIKNRISEEEKMG